LDGSLKHLQEAEKWHLDKIFDWLLGRSGLKSPGIKNLLLIIHGAER
jgi:hypothetical protein